MGTSIFYSAPLLHQASVTLTNAQIKALPTNGNGITIVGAAGAGTIMMPQFAMLKCASVAAYTNIDVNTEASIWLSSAVECVKLSNTTNTTIATLLGASEASMYAYSPAESQIVSTVTGGFPMYGSDVDNVEMVFRIVNGSPTSDFTGGNAANSLTVTVAYLVFNTTSGQFV